ncbi:hypothetical protein K7X08_003190 [Anisodus acutangulus]|uniref:Uncharacterized protein n=2 Tax=Anisodus TaxID=243963 RepID=A0A9Q1RIF7_9SOLA|nr:hypothetical protein K7X08_003190 [Anisodus acutangulus]KAK4367113.1 hypothetical protein RND71_014993 [Anisodus tanguticus]
MKDDWISAALSDDTVVVELLFRLKQHHPNSPTAAVGLHLTLPLNSWGRRKPRSKPPSSSISVKKEKAAYTTTTTTTTTTRCSPTTPLSWSGGTASPSDDGSDLSSKGNFTYETSNISSSRSKKKRTFTELKEEENLLLKESVHLKRELASVHVNLNEQRARSDNLKRMKFDLNTQSSNEMAAESVSNRLLEPSKRTNRAAVDDLVSSDSGRTENQNRGFFLPDLNAMPSEDEIGTLWN